MGVNVYRLRYGYVFVGGLLAGLAGATITLAIQPGWFGDLTVGGRGWIAVGLVIFAQWDPFRARIGRLPLRGHHALDCSTSRGRPTSSASPTRSSSTSR